MMRPTEMPVELLEAVEAVWPSDEGEAQDAETAEERTEQAQAGEAAEAGLVPEEVSREVLAAVRRLVELVAEAAERLRGQLDFVRRTMARALCGLEQGVELALELARRLAQSQAQAGSRRVLMQPRAGERLRLCRCVGRPRRGTPPPVVPRARRMCGSRRNRRRGF